MTVKIYDNFFTKDYTVDQGWLRVLCAPLPDDTCGLFLFQQHFKNCNQYFDHSTEANIGMITGGSFDGAMKILNQGGQPPPLPAAYRRLNRLLQNGQMEEVLKDTLAERGLERAVAYNHSEKNQAVRLAMFDRAGWRAEERDGVQIRILDLE